MLAAHVEFMRCVACGDCADRNCADGDCADDLHLLSLT